MYLKRTILIFLSIPAFHFCYSQQAVTSIATTTVAATPITYTNVKGAEQRGISGAVASAWDSSGTSFTTTFNATGINTKLTQFTVTGHANPFIPVAVGAQVKIRRRANAYVNDTRNHFNFWSSYTATPVNNAISGTFSMNGPEVSLLETSLLTNNIESGYDNIFENTINNLHAGNIERVDFIIPGGIKPVALYDVNNAGVLMLDRGNGDPFKVAVITSVDASNNPLSYGPLVSVATGDFGGNLLSGNMNYTIFIHDPVFGARSRPSTKQGQNIRGVFLSLGNLGVAVNQRIYGYSLFGQDVLTANIDWNTYPNNTDAASMLDPVNVMALFKDVASVLPVPPTFQLKKTDDGAVVDITVAETGHQSIAVERSDDARNFETIGTVAVTSSGTWSFADREPLPGLSYYRLKFESTPGQYVYSDTKLYRGTENGQVKISPIPVQGTMRIGIPSSWKNKTVLAQLFDAGGRKVKETRFSTTGYYDMPVGEMKRGSYFLRLSVPGDAAQLQPLVIIH